MLGINCQIPAALAPEVALFDNLDSTIAKYNKTISEVKNDTKKVLEKSWFIKGTLLIAQGFKSGEVFRVKSLSRIVSVDDLGKVKSTKYRYGE